MDSDVQCRFIFSIREEYFAGVTEFEHTVPDFISNRMRIEKMTWSNAMKVIEEPCKAYKIEVEAGLADIILGKLSPESSDVELTYLQVLLDRLFRSASEKSEENPVFSKELFAQLGDVSDLLGSFLEEQINQLDDPDTGLVILKAFVSVKGTKRQVTSSDIHDFASTLGKLISEDELNNLIQKFVKLRLLKDKDDNGRYELRHDSLASKIYEEITLYEKELLEVRQFLDNAYDSYQSRKKLLSKDDLEYILPYEKKLYLNPGIIKFIEVSKREIQKAKRRRRQIVTVLTVALIIVLSGFTIWALNERKKSGNNYRLARANNYNFLAKETVEKDPTIALRLAEYAWDLDQNDNIKQTLHRIYGENNFYRIIAKHDASIISIKISPDGNTIFTGSGDNTVRLWDLKGNLLKVIETHEENINSVVRSVAISPDDKIILTGSDDGSARIWDLSGNLLKVIKAHEEQIFSVAISPDGKNILTGSGDHTARLWDLSGNLLKVFTGHKFGISSVAFSPDGKNILSGSGDYTARLWDLSGNLLKVFKTDGNVYSIAFSPDGMKILTGSNDNIAQLWDLSGNLLQVFKGHDWSISSVVFSPDGENILTGSWDQTARLWDLSGNVLKVFKGHEGFIYSVAFSPDGESILTGSSDKTARIWDITGNTCKVFEGFNISAIAFSPDERNILTGTQDGTVQIWDLNFDLLKTFKGHEDQINSLAFSPDGKNILTGSSEGTARLWDLTGNLLQVYKGHWGQITSVAFSPDSKSIVTGSMDQIARLWDLSGNVLKVFKGHEGFIYSMAFSPDGKSILTGSRDQTARLWDLDGNIIKEFSLQDGSITSLAFSQSGDTIYLGSSSFIVKLPGGDVYSFSGADNISAWDTSGNQLWMIESGDYLNNIKIYPDNNCIFFATDYQIKLLDFSGIVLQTCQEVTPDNSIISLSYSPAFSKLVAGCFDGSVIMWEPKKPLEQFQKEKNYQELSVILKLEYGILDYEGLLQSNNPEDLYLGAMYYYDKVNSEVERSKKIDCLTKAKDIYKQILSTKKEVKYYSELLDVYLALCSIESETKNIISESGKIQSLFLSIKGKEAQMQVLEYYNKQCRDLDQIKSKLEFPQRMLDACENLLESCPDDTVIRGDIASKCNDLSYTLLFNKEFSIAMRAAQLAKQADGKSKYTCLNLPLAYIFNDQYDAAQEIYLKWKDIRWSDNLEYQFRNLFISADFSQTYRELFLMDIDSLEHNGIIHPDLEKAKELLSISGHIVVNNDFVPFQNSRIIAAGPCYPDISVSNVAINGSTSIQAFYPGGNWGGFMVFLDSAIDLSNYRNGKLVVMLNMPENVKDFELKLESKGGVGSVNLMDYTHEAVNSNFDKYTIPLQDFVELGVKMESITIPFALWSPKDKNGQYITVNILVDNLYFELSEY